MAKKSTASARNQSQNLQAACGGLDNALPYTNLCCVLKLNSRQMNRSVMPVLYFFIACFQFYVGLLFPVCVVLIVIIVWLVLMILAYDRFCYFGFSGFCLPHSVCPPVYDLYAVSTRITELIFCIWCLCFVCLYTLGYALLGLWQIPRLAGTPWLIRILDADVLPHLPISSILVL